MIQATVVNRAFAETFEFMPEIHVISITRIENVPARIKGTNNVLYLFFDDNDTDFNANHAEQVIDFVSRSDLKRLFIHCDAGISRSAGILDALMVIFPDTFVWARPDGSRCEEMAQFKPNVHVKSTIIKFWMDWHNYYA